MYYLTLSVSQESRCSLAGSSGSVSLTGGNQRINLSCNHLKALLGKRLFPRSTTRLLVGVVSLMLFGLRASISPFAKGNLPIWQLAALEQTSTQYQRERERVQVGQKSPSLCKPILEIISHPFCHILFIRIESQHSRGGDYTRAWNPGGGDNQGPFQKLPTISMFKYKYVPIAFSLLPIYYSFLVPFMLFETKIKYLAFLTSMLEPLLLPQATVRIAFHSISQTIMPKTCHVLFPFGFWRTLNVLTSS